MNCYHYYPIIYDIIIYEYRGYHPHVGKYTIHGAYGIPMTLHGFHGGRRNLPQSFLHSLGVATDATDATDATELEAAAPVRTGSSFH